MEPLTLGELTIIEISLITIMKGVEENSELGQQILECIAKVDLWIKEIRAEFETKLVEKPKPPADLAPLTSVKTDLPADSES